MGGSDRDAFGRGPVVEWASRLGIALLCWRMRFWKVESDVPALIHPLSASRDERTWALAGRGLDLLWHDPRFTQRVLAAIDEAAERRPGPPPGVTSFLTAARLSAYLGGAEPAGREHKELAWQVVDGFLTATDAQAHRHLFDLLTVTDQPMLLRRLEAKMSRALDLARYDPRMDDPDIRSRASSEPGQWPELWTDGRPTPLMDVLLANPNLPLPRGNGWLDDHDRAVLAVLKGRYDAGPDDGVIARAMLAALRLPVPGPIATGCRSGLRELPPGEGPEAVCRAAIDGDGEARNAAVEAGYLPADDHTHPLFLFATEQWERYDRADPDGSLLRGCCRDGIGLSAAANVAAVAARAGRPNPCPPPPPPPPRPKPEPGSPRRGAIGSWPTSLTGDAGGYSGYTGFGGI